MVELLGEILLYLLYWIIGYPTGRILALIIMPRYRVELPIRGFKRRPGKPWENAIT